jgi:predicted DNA-binding protein (UPF0251 family)
LRQIGFTPNVGFFRPVGVPACALEQVTLALDEVEALRLADLEGLYQEQAAARMKISRPTFSRIVEQARRKVADALIHGKALRLEGGVVQKKETTERPGREGAEAERLGHGPCGGRRRGPQEAETTRCGRCHGHLAPRVRPTTRNEMRQPSETKKGEQKS